MKVTKREVTREEFINALNEAESCMKTKYKDTKLAYWCEVFIDENKAENKAHTKKVSALQKTITRDLKNFLIDHAIKKHDILVKNKNGAYQFTPENEKLIIAEREKFDERLANDIDVLFSEKVVVSVVIDPLKELPEDLDFDANKILNGFVFNNPKLFSETIERVEVS